MLCCGTVVLPYICVCVNTPFVTWHFQRTGKVADLGSHGRHSCSYYESDLSYPCSIDFHRISLVFTGTQEDVLSAVVIVKRQSHMPRFEPVSFSLLCVQYCYYYYTSTKYLSRYNGIKYHSITSRLRGYLLIVPVQQYSTVDHRATRMLQSSFYKCTS